MDQVRLEPTICQLRVQYCITRRTAPTKLAVSSLVDSILCGASYVRFVVVCLCHVGCCGNWCHLCGASYVRFVVVCLCHVGCCGNWCHLYDTWCRRTMIQCTNCTSCQTMSCSKYLVHSINCCHCMKVTASTCFTFVWCQMMFAMSHENAHLGKLWSR